jgi:uncharacterized protein (TIGR02118 family)
MIKLVYVVQARDDVEPEEFHRYWLEEHGPLVASVTEDIRARKYIQSHTIETPLNQALVDSRGMAPIHQGITEVWWDSIEELEAALATPEGAAAGARLAEDEAKFIDFGRSTIFLTEEHTIFDR